MEKKPMPPRPLRDAQQAAERQSRLQKTLCQMEAVETRAKLRIERINRAKTLKLQALASKARMYALPLISFFLKHHAELSHGTKTARLDHGEMQMSEGVWQIEVTDEAAAIAWLEKHKKKDALRYLPPELDKEYLHAHPDLIAQVPGIERIRKPKHILKFAGTDTKIEHSPETGRLTIVTPKKKD
jgi:phage host-nuclease inhibitor protein Gam